MENNHQWHRVSNNRFARWTILIGSGLAVFVGCTSPDLWTIGYLGAALLLLGLVIGFRIISLRYRWLAIRLDARIAVLLTTLCVCVAVSELALRVVLTAALPDWRQRDRTSADSLGFQHDRNLGWFPVPNDRRILTAGPRAITISNNSDGFRDVEPVWDTRSRIVFIGDSFLWGTGLETNERFTDKLRARHPDWAPYNFGVVGSPVPLPDYAFCQKYPFISKSYLIRLAMRAWGNLRCHQNRIFRRDVTFQILEALRKYILAHGAKFYVGLTAPEPELEGFLERCKVPYLELNTELRIQGDFHWSAQGNTVAADKIEEFLKKQQFGKADVL